MSYGSHAEVSESRLPFIGQITCPRRGGGLVHSHTNTHVDKQNAITVFCNMQADYRTKNKCSHPGNNSKQCNNKL